LIGTGSIYAITPVSEDIARRMAAERKSRPVQAYEMPAALPAPTVDSDPYDDADPNDDSDGDWF
jgi:hypothetical protein